MLKTSPANQITMKTMDSPSADPLRKFSMIWGEKTTIQQAIDTDLIYASANGELDKNCVWRHGSLTVGM